MFSSVKMTLPSLSRRQLLLSGALLLASSLPGRAQKQGVLRIGAVFPAPTQQDPLGSPVWEAARMGLELARDEFSLNAQIIGQKLEVSLVPAPDAAAASRAAERLAKEGAYALIGGLGPGQAPALSQLAQRQRVPFLNIGSPLDSLRNQSCGRYVFHLEASAAMYLDALTDWYIRAGFRRWFTVYPDTEEGRALYARTRKALLQRHFGAQEAGQAVLAPVRPDLARALAAIAKARADMVLLLLDGPGQLEFLGQYETAGLSAAVTGFPYPETQTRSFFAASRSRAKKAGSGYRTTLWEAKLDAYGARELNARFMGRYQRPMDPSAWAAYMAVKMLFETATLGGARERGQTLGYLEHPQTIFDVYKGIGVSFRPWDHQLRQSLYLVKIDPKAKDAWNYASLVGELPAIYRPGTDPVERLDQLGDLRRDSSCRFAGGS